MKKAQPGIVVNKNCEEHSLIQKISLLWFNYLLRYNPDFDYKLFEHKIRWPNHTVYPIIDFIAMKSEKETHINYEKKSKRFPVLFPIMKTQITRIMHEDN